MTLRGMGPSRLVSIQRSVRAHGFTMTALAEHAARAHGDRPALIVDDWTATYDELWRAAEGVAAVLYLGALQRQARAVVIACDGSAMPIALLAAARLGLDVMPVSPRALATDAELARAVPHDALLVHDGVRPEWHEGPAVTASEIMEWSTTDGAGLGATRRRARIVLPSRTAAGTVTTHVQGAMGLQGLRQLAGLLDRLGIVGTDVTLVCAPLHRRGGLQMLGMALLTGATLVAAAHTSVARRLELISERFISVLSVSPSQLAEILGEVERSPERAPRLRRIFVTGEDLDAELVRRAQATWGPIVLSAYGTVQTGTVAVATPEVLAKHPGSFGYPLPGTEFGVVGKRGRGDAEGMLWVRGAHATVITEDHGRIDDGRLALTGALSRPDPAE